MPQKLLGLDLGSYSIKAALFGTTFKAFELTDLYESPPLQLDEIDPEDRPVVIKEALLRLISENNIEASAVITALGGVQVSNRILTLPLPPKQVEKVLLFELESHLPFELEDIVVDHHIISGQKTETTCLAAAVKKTTLAEHLALLQSANLDPAFVGLDSLSLYNLHQLSLPDYLGTYAIVDVGHQKTSVCVISKREAKYVRTLFSGGKAITESIRNELDLTWEQAQEVKHSHGILEMERHPLQSRDLRKLSSAIQKAVDPLLREILQSLQAYKAQYSKELDASLPLDTIYLCGGSSQIRNLPEYMENLTKLSVKRLNVFPEGHEAGERLGSRAGVLAQSIALGMRLAARGAESKRTAEINFRKNEFAFARDLSGLKEKAFFFGRWVAAVFLMALIHQGCRYQSLSKQRKQYDKAILKIYSEIVPNDPAKPKDATQAMRNLETKIAQYQKEQEILTAGLNELTALGVLREISSRVPAEVSLDTQELSIDRNKITLRGNTDSFASVDRIISVLKEFPHFQKIDKGDIRESPDGKKSFMLTVTVGAEKEEKPTPRRKG
jgi:type IV pilus assembly protein PilM